MNHDELIIMLEKLSECPTELLIKELEVRGWVCELAAPEGLEQVAMINERKFMLYDNDEQEGAESADAFGNTLDPDKVDELNYEAEWNND